MNRCSLVLPTVLGVLSAQGAGLTPAASLSTDRVPVHRHVDQPGEAPYGTWAVGARYKARFDGGMTFYPQLGRDYPHNQPFAWRTTSVRIGSAELLGAAAPRPMTHTDWRVEYSLGPVVEAYDVLAHGLEQTFVLARRPADTGDLRITGEVTTALWTPAVEEAVGDLVFRDAAGAAILAYGRAVAVDADGDVFAMTTTCSGGTITLRLPAASLQQADFPLVVDPLVSTTFLLTGIGTAVALGDADAATEDVNVGYDGAYVRTRHFSATDSDVEVAVGASALIGASARFYDAAATASADHGRLGYCAATNKWVLAYQNLVTSSQLMQLRVALMSAGATTPMVTTSLPHLLASGVHEWRPVVGGQAGGTGPHVLIVYQQESGTTAFANTAASQVMGLLFDTSTTLGVYGTAFAIRGGGSEDAERPAVNRAAEGGATSSWFTVCQVYNNTVAGDDWDLVGRLVDGSGVLQSGTWISSLGSVHKLGPVVDGRAGRYLVAFATAATTTGKVQDVLGTELRCERLDWATGALGQSAAGDWPVQTLQTNQFRVLETGGVACNAYSRSHWAIAWRSSTTSPAVYATRVGYRGVALQNPDLVASSLGVTVPGVPFVVHDNSVGMTVIGYETLVNGVADLTSRRFDLPSSMGAQLSLGGCSNVIVGWDGPAPSNLVNDDYRIGCEFSGFSVQGAPANSLHLVFVTTATANLPVVDPLVGTNCTLLVPISGPDCLGNLPLAVGASAAWPLPLPENLPGVTLYFQDWVLEPANGRFWGSRRLEVPLVK